MPQPLSRVNPNAGVMIGNAGDYPLERNPNLLRLSMRVMTAWATLTYAIIRVSVPEPSTLGCSASVSWV